MKLRNKILSLTLPLILIPFLLTALAVYYFIIRANQIQDQEETNRSLAEAVVNLRKDLEAARKDASILANAPPVVGYLDLVRQTESPAEAKIKEENARTILQIFFDQNPYYLQLSLVDASGREKIKFSKLPDDQEPRDLRAENYFRRTLISGRFQSPVRKITNERYATVLTNRVRNSEFLGMIVLTLNTEIFERRLRPLLTSRDLSTVLFDDSGLIFAESLLTEAEEKALEKINLAGEAENLLAKPSLEFMRKEILAGENEFLFSVLPAEAFERSVYEPQAGENWFLGSLQKQESIEAATRAFQIFFFAIVLLAVIAVFFVTAKAARRITIPLEKVDAATKQIARGNLEIGLDINTGDEVEELATAVRKMADELREYQARVVQTAKLAAIGEMASEVSHEIQNRISGISLWIQHLDADLAADDPRREYLEEMKQGLRGFMEMLASLKQYYKTPVLNLSEIDLNLLVKETLPFARDKIEKRKIEIELNLDSFLPDLQGDAEKLKSVFLNLLLNAAEAVDGQGKIKVQTLFEKEKSAVSFSVKDNGGGIAEEDLPRIFYPFYSNKSGGSGLGLAIASNQIAAHGGKIEVESENGNGAIFKVVLPVNNKNTGGNSNFMLKENDSK